MQRANGPIPPLYSPGPNSDFASRYGALGSAPPSDPISAGPYGGPRPPPANSPPASGHPSSSTDSSRPSGSSRSTSMNRPPSSASSVAVSDGGRPPFKGQPSNRDSARSHFKPESEEVLARHYNMLKGYLASHLQDEQGNIKPNRARDKLLRLSVTQFMELSTDVFDELLRREDERTRRVPNVPRFLLPRNNFHPKRNQARQKLSTLPIERFRQLATDVFFELERRIPRFIADDIPRPMSTASNRSNRAPSRGGMRPPPPGFPRGPPTPGGRGMAPPGAPYGAFRPQSPGPGGPLGSRRPSEAASIGRPLPKNLQSNTIVPNKGTMVEDDDSDGEGGSVYGSSANEADAERLRAQESEISELKERLEDVEAKLLEKEQHLEKERNSGQDREDGLSKERNEWFNVREELEQRVSDAEGQNYALRQELEAKVKDAEQLNADLRSELNRLQMSRSQDQTKHEELRQQLESSTRGAMSNEGYESRIRVLQEELAEQQKVSNEVRDEATTYLREMRDLSRENDKAVEQEEKLAAHAKKLEGDVEAWRQRYAKVKAQNKTLRASTMGLGLQMNFDAGSLARKEGLMSTGGLVRDVDVTRFQVSIDELLKVARQSNTDAMLETVKQVVTAVQGITTAVSGTDGYPTPSPSPLSPSKGNGQARNDTSVAKLKARVTGTANSLITATKQHASASGLSPVALLDAAASNLTSCVVELVKAVGIKVSSKADLDDADADAASAAYSHLGQTNGHHHAAHPSASLSANDDLDSFYDSSKSSGERDRSPPRNVQIDVPHVDTATAAAVRPPALNVTRSNTQKKANGWFRWPGRRDDAGEDDEPPTPIAQTPMTPAVALMNGARGPGEPMSATSSYDGEEYDPYK